MNTKLSVFCSKIIEAGWLVAVVAVPLFFNIYSARTFEPDKITLLRSIVSLMILAWIIMGVEQGGGDGSISVKTRIRKWLKIPLFLPTLALVVIYIISTAFSISPKVSLWGSYQRLQGGYSALSYIVVFALMAGNLRAREQVDRLITIIIVASVPVSLYGIIQHYGLDPLPWAGNVTARVASNMGNAIFVASYLIMIIPITISRLIESMVAIVREEKASWGHTILAAVYIFVLAIQVITIVFSRSRGPMLGILGAGFIMGLLLLLALRQTSLDVSRLSLSETGLGLLFVIPLIITGGLVGGGGYLLGAGIEKLLLSVNYQVDNVSLLAALIGGMLGFLGAYVFMAASGKGWRWLWVSWLGIAVLAIAFVLTLNVYGTPLDTYLDQIRALPNMDRLSSITRTDGGTGKVRTLIWDAAMDLIAPHAPLGIEEDGFAPTDLFNLIRPLIGYGPESMFNAFAYVYPPGLAHVETRGSSADRSHNETMDSLVITGVLGFLAFYFLMISIFYYTLKWLGWASNTLARRRLIGLLLLFGIVGTLIPYLIQGRFTFMPVGLPFGLIAGMGIHLVWQGLAAQPDNATTHPVGAYTLLLIGLLGAIIGHFIEVHFVFSIAATYTYFWVYLGLLVAIFKIANLEQKPVPEQKLIESDTPDTETIPAEQPAESPVAATRRSRKGRSRRGARRKTVSGSVSRPVPSFVSKQENWETWLGSQVLTMAIVLIILAFNFITPQFEFSLSNKNSASLFWMLIITWLVGAAIAISTLAVRRDDWRGQISWGRAALLYSITSLSYFFFYTMAHRIQFGQRITVTSVADVIRAASVLTNGLVVFYVFLLLLMLIIAITLSWRRLRGLTFWRAENWWLYPPLALFTFVVLIWFQNINVVRADVYLKEGERYRNNRQWNQAIALHERALSLDSDEDFYYLMLALDYQLMAQDNNLDQAARQQAWLQGERIALDAREVNPYNPDNTGNMGRYYFTLGQVFDRAKFQDALDFFRKATVLAPSNVIYHNLWAQTDYIMQNYESAVDKLQTSISIDGKYPPTWVLLGDTYAAMGNVDKALEAHSEGMKFRGNWSVFGDQFLDQRLNFYISAGRGNDIIAAMQRVILEREAEAASADSADTQTFLNTENANVQWAVGHTYELMGQHDKALPYFEQARALGDESDRVTRSLANIYLASNEFDKAVPNYQLILEKNANDVEANSAMAFIFAQQGRLDEAIQHNQKVLEQSPTDYDSLKNLAILYQQKQQWPAALSAAQQAQAAAPEAEKASWTQFVVNVENQIAANN